MTGNLAGGQPFTTTIPVALGGNGLAGQLAAHHVQVTATAAAASSPLLSALIGLLPLLLLGGLLYVGFRSVRRQAGGRGGGIGHLTSLTKAKAGSSTPSDRPPGSPTGRLPRGQDRDQRGR